MSCPPPNPKGLQWVQEQKTKWRKLGDEKIASVRQVSEMHRRWFQSPSTVRALLASRRSFHNVGTTSGDDDSSTLRDSSTKDYDQLASPSPSPVRTSPDPISPSDVLPFASVISTMSCLTEEEPTNQPRSLSLSSDPQNDNETQTTISSHRAGSSRSPLYNKEEQDANMGEKQLLDSIRKTSSTAPSTIQHDIYSKASTTHDKHDLERFAVNITNPSSSFANTDTMDSINTSSQSKSYATKRRSSRLSTTSSLLNNLRLSSDLSSSSSPSTSSSQRKAIADGMDSKRRSSATSDSLPPTPTAPNDTRRRTLLKRSSSVMSLDVPLSPENHSEKSSSSQQAFSTFLTTDPSINDKQWDVDHSPEPYTPFTPIRTRASPKAHSWTETKPSQPDEHGGDNVRNNDDDDDDDDEVCIVESVRHVDIVGGRSRPSMGIQAIIEANAKTKQPSFRRSPSAKSSTGSSASNTSIERNNKRQSNDVNYHSAKRIKSLGASSNSRANPQSPANKKAPPITTPATNMISNNGISKVSKMGFARPTVASQIKATAVKKPLSPASLASRRNLMSTSAAPQKKSALAYATSSKTMPYTKPLQTNVTLAKLSSKAIQLAANETLEQQAQANGTETTPAQAERSVIDDNESCDSLATVIPSWAEDPELTQILERQREIDADSIFMSMPAFNMEEIFSEMSRNGSSSFHPIPVEQSPF
ncbi:uncharacterized protein BYT42DRAFT_646905 [Radiomyces spectabilis]|uniref:uncharacterized protein n=1 Tax=Radiomyces spectabilis TaxID=64574 RepID=UPI00221F445D|nr:uncharacterized protein BYT42DRAFT_646905 [Radiomyces spectabilis]KAI8372941.1 hypothetical protein BYT42DRAFT_646905 [Radiomyces spectabilis]